MELNKNTVKRAVRGTNKVLACCGSASMIMAGYNIVDSQLEFSNPNGMLAKLYHAGTFATLWAIGTGVYVYAGKMLDEFTDFVIDGVDHFVKGDECE